MKTILIRHSKLVILPLLLLAGCVQVSGHRSPDGALTISTHRLLWSSEGITFTTSSAADGKFVTTLTVQKSNPDAQAIGAVAEGVAKGLAASVKP